MKIILSNDGHFELTQRHLDWLNQNGHAEVTPEFWCDNRSHPALIACIEAIKNQNEILINQAIELQARYKRLNEGAKADIKTAQEASEKLQNAWTAKRYVALEKLPEFRHFEEARSAESIRNRDDAKFDLELFCANHNIKNEDHIGYTEQFYIEDPFKVFEYDETRFHAEIKVVDRAIPYSGFDFVGCQEELVLIPYLTRETIAKYAATNDIDGLMTYLESLNLNLQIE